MQPRAKSRVFTFVTICFRSLTAVFYFFLPQSGYNEWAKTFLLSSNVRHQALSEAAVKYERALGSRL